MMFKSLNTSFTPKELKTYQDLKIDYFRLGMKPRLAKYISKCATCAQLKSEHQV